MSLEGKLVAVTGASGHVGANLVRLLVERGFRVRALVHRHQEALEGLEVERAAADLADPESLEKALSGVEVVFHLAAHISILEADARQMEEINVRGTQRVVAACLKSGVRRLVLASSIEALLAKDSPPEVSEEPLPDEAQLLSAYARTKNRALREAMAARGRGLEVVAVFPTAVVGPWDGRPSLMGQAILDFAHRRLPCLVPGGFDFVDARDVAEGLLLAAEKGRDGEGYILSGEYLTLKEMAGVLGELTGAEAPRFTLPGWLAVAAAQLAVPYYLLFRKTPRFTPQSIRMLRHGGKGCRKKAEQELGYRPRPAAQAFAGAAEWFRERDYLKRVFFSHHDFMPVALVAVFLLACFSGGLLGLFGAASADRLWGAGALAVGLAYLLISWPVRYTLGRRELLVQAGLLRWRIPREEITGVERSQLKIGAPAWSWRRLKINYRSKGKPQSLLIAPEKPEEFLALLAEKAGASKSP